MGCRTISNHSSSLTHSSSSRLNSRTSSSISSQPLTLGANRKAPLRMSSAMASSNPSRETCRLVDRRDGERCVRCGATYNWAGFSRHHRHLRSHPFPGLHLPSNLILLCGSGSNEGCHLWVHTHQREAMDNGWLVSGFNDHPEQVPVMVYGKGLVLLDNMGGFTLCS